MSNLVGTWVFNGSDISYENVTQLFIELPFTCNGVTYTYMDYQTPDFNGIFELDYDATMVYNNYEGGWQSDEYKTITITGEPDPLTYEYEAEKLEELLTEYATKQTPAVTYSVISTDLINLADTIRGVCGTSEPLEWPGDFEGAIADFVETQMVTVEINDINSGLNFEDYKIPPLATLTVDPDEPWKATLEIPRNSMFSSGLNWLDMTPSTTGGITTSKVTAAGRPASYVYFFYVGATDGSVTI